MPLPSALLFSTALAAPPDQLAATVAFSSTFFLSREVRIDRRDTGTITLTTRPDGHATLAFQHDEKGSTSRSKYVSRSGEHELERRAGETAWTATGTWTDGPDGRIVVLTDKAWANALDRPFPLTPALGLACKEAPAFGPTSTVCTVSDDGTTLDPLAIDATTRQPWLHRGDPRQPAPQPSGRKALWLGRPSIALRASRRDAAPATITTTPGP